MKIKNNFFLLLATASLLVFSQSCTNNNQTTSNTPTTTPPTETKPTETPVATTPPTETKPKETPVATTPPTETKPKETPVATTPPTETPLATTPPTETTKPEFNQEIAAKWTDTSKLLAGIKLGKDSKLSALEKTASWKNHNQFFNNSWSKLETQQLAKVRKWSETELKTINQSPRHIFYPFSGPDILYAYSLFPNGSDYYLIGLEPIGIVPDFAKISNAEKELKLREVQGSLYAILQFSFFRTNDMKADLAQQGVLPILLVFLARTNNKILDVQYVGIDKDANIQKLDIKQGMVPGVKISFMPQGKSTPRTLYYFSTDLSDEGLKKTPQFPEFVKKIAQPITYLKAASYLMYYDYFSQIRNLILAQSTNILQDDSGMPVVYFDRNKWDLKFFGTYTAPIALFQNMYQPDLRKIYQTNKNIKPLDFGIGYKFGRNESNLMLATLKKKPQ